MIYQNIVLRNLFRVLSIVQEAEAQYILKDKIKAIALLGFTTKVEINIILNIGLT